MRNNYIFEFCLVNSSIYCSLSSSGVPPSNLQYSIPLSTQKSSKIFKTEVNCEKSKACSLFFTIFYINLSTRINLPEA